MISFKKYHSIENSYREKEVNKIIQNIPKDIQWVCTEKIHGTNFSFITDGKIIKTAKRSSILSESDSFYDSNLMLEKYKQNVLEIFKILKNKNPNIQYIQIYTEHFGGYYDGKSLSKMIQKGVEYIPFTDVIVYDILLIYDDYDEFLNWDELKEIVDKCNMKYVPEVFRGTFKECLNYTNQYITKVPELYGLPQKENNICEGNVIKPVIDIRIGRLKERPILKSKNEKFKEKRSVKRKNYTENVTEEQRKWVDIIVSYFNRNRFDNVFSKGDLEKDWKYFGKISGFFFKDAYDDFIKDNPEFLNEDKKVQKFIKNLAQKQCNNFVREILKEVLNEN